MSLLSGVLGPEVRDGVTLEEDKKEIEDAEDRNCGHHDPCQTVSFGGHVVVGETYR